jgi:hypothetical protein
MVQVNKTYTLRNGLKTSKLRIANNGTNYIFEADVKEPKYPDPSVLTWNRLGRFLGQNTDHKFDIIPDENI